MFREVEKGRVDMSDGEGVVRVGGRGIGVREGKGGRDKGRWVIGVREIEYGMEMGEGGRLGVCKGVKGKDRRRREGVDERRGNFVGMLGSMGGMRKG